VIREHPELVAQLSLAGACGALGVNRGSYYRHPPRRSPPALESRAVAVRLRARIEALVLEFPGYGYRRVTAQLQREGWRVNHKRVLRIMREESLLCELQRRWVKTTDSEHGWRTYPNLLARRGWQQLTGLNQAWVADLTYIRLREGFCYLAALLDAFSRKVVGWHVGEGLDASLTVTALERALAERQPQPGWIHHSDQGVQYACRDYVAVLDGAKARISMAAKGTPRENAQVESFFRTLKYEEVYLQEYETLADIEQSIGRFIETVYNEKRLHSSLGYRPPSEFEDLVLAGLLHG
jgi:transposase InsO family protein